MKDLIFLENDYKCPDSDDCISNAKRQLYRFQFTKEQIERMNIVYQFGLLEKEEKYNIIFDTSKILVTHSVYIQGSDSDFVYLTAATSRNGIKDLIYIDTSGAIVKFLNRRLKDFMDNPYQVFLHSVCGINSNFILTRDEDLNLKRVKIEFKRYYDDIVTLEDFNFNP